MTRNNPITVKADMTAFGSAIAILMRPAHKAAARLHRRASERGIRAAWCGGSGVAMVTTAHRNVTFADTGEWTAYRFGAMGNRRSITAHADLTECANMLKDT